MLLSDVDFIDLKNGYIIRKPLPDADAQDIMDSYTHVDVAKYIPDDLIPQTKEEAVDLVDYYRRAVYTDHMAYWSIANADTNQMVGLIGFCNIDHQNNRAEIAYEIHPDYQGRGIVSASVRKMIDIMFSDYKMERIQANVMLDNKKSISLLLSVGFTKEGVLESYRFFKGKQVDVLMFGLSAKNYFLHTKRTNIIKENRKNIWHSIKIDNNSRQILRIRRPKYANE